jgi:hypothetical protein
LILDFEFDQHLESHKHVISIIMRFRDTGCYSMSSLVPYVIAHGQQYVAMLLCHWAL